MARETKIGLALILILCGVFGFVLYRKFNAQQELLATAKAAREKEDKEELPPTKSKKRSAGVETASRETEGETEFVEPAKTQTAANDRDPFAGQQEPSEEAEDLFAPAAKTKVTRPSANDLDEDPFATQAQSQTTQKAPRARAAKPARDDFSGFDDPPIQPGRGSAEPEESFEPPMNRTAGAAPPPPGQGGDPFGGNVAGNEEPPTEPQDPADGGGMQVAGNETEATDPFGQPASRAVRPTPSARTTARPLNEFEPAATPARPRATTPPPQDPFRNVAPPARVASPAPPSHAELEVDAFGSAARPLARSATGGAIDPRATAYEVQPNDNYWIISKKQYGTYRYFHALSRYNADRIPDPTKLRPGMKVLTPAPQVLESRFPELLGGKVAGGEVAAVTEAPGFYVAPNGQPMYRIGSHDTLTTIARAHLGRSSRWIQIYELNRDHLKSPEELQIGTSLRLPLDASSVRVSNAPVERR